MHKKLIHLLFLIPTFFVSIFLFSFAISLFPITITLPPLFSFVYSLYTYGIGLIFIVLIDLLVLSHIFLQLTKRKWRIAAFLQTIYTTYQTSIVLSVVLSSSTLLMLVASMFFAPPFDYDVWQTILLVGNFFFCITMLLLVVFFPKKKLGAAFVAVGLTAVIGFVFYFIYGIYSDFAPQEFMTFPLDDKKGEYIVNYDGDYWVTYLTKQKVCFAKGCKMEFVKKGNTSITNSPVDLAPFKDKRVRITGTFKPSYGAQWEGKQLCIGEGLSRTCKNSTGPGVWYASPLQINSIQEDKK